MLDRRLKAFSELPIKVKQVRNKLGELRATRSHASFKANTLVDGVIEIDSRSILVEATNTVQRVIPDFVGVFSVDPDIEIDQVIKKVRKKVADGRQLAVASGRPTVLFLARTHLGADRMSARIALRECFASPEYSALSGVVVADSWKLYVTEWHQSTAPDVPLSSREGEQLKLWYGVRN